MQHTLYSVKRQAQELKSKMTYTMEDIEELADQAGPIFQDYWRGAYPEDVQMEVLIEDVFSLFFAMSFNLDKVDPDLQDLYARVVQVHNGLNQLWTEKRSTFVLDDVRKLQEELATIEEAKNRGAFRDTSGNVPRGQAMLNSMMEKSYRLARLLNVEAEEMHGVDSKLRDLHVRLLGVHKALTDMINGTNKHVTLEAIQMQQRELAEISSLEKDGKFFDESGQIPRGQATITKLLATCYRLAHHLLVKLDS